MNAMSPDTYEIRCDCGAVLVRLHGPPRVRAYCHCSHCRNLHDVAVHALAAWDQGAVTVVGGEYRLVAFAYPGTEMVRYWCRDCGTVLFNTNRARYRVVALGLLRKRYGDRIPPELRPDRHIFYRSRVVDIDDDLPKYLDGYEGARYDREP